VSRVGAPPKPMEIGAMALISKRPVITGSLIGGLKETQEMLDFCGKHNITSEIENIPATPDSIKTAFDRTMKSDVKYRFVLDMLNAFK
jgi:alcohol dehydrogenase (NADP+)